MQACGPWSSAPVSGETPPDVWPCLADPDWASYTLGVFICLSCSGIHRNIPHVSKVKSVRLDTWEDVQVEVRLGWVPGDAFVPLQPRKLVCSPASGPVVQGCGWSRG